MLVKCKKWGMTRKELKKDFLDNIDERLKNLRKKYKEVKVCPFCGCATFINMGERRFNCWKCFERYRKIK